MSPSETHHFLVGTFNTPHIYTLAFTPSSTSPISIIHRSDAIGSHSWLHLSPSKRNLYATAWTEPPSIVAYAIDSPTSIRTLNSATTASRSGYVTASETAAYSAGGASGEVFALDPETGAFSSSAKDSSSSSSTPSEAIQTLSFVDAASQRDDGSTMDFGGLRHGAHSADLSPSGDALYVADIGRNCIWVYSVSPSDGKLTLSEKHISPRSHDGPRHVHPHPGGGVVYCLQEHSSMVDVFKVNDGKLEWVQGVRIIPDALDHGLFWADEVRTSLGERAEPKWMYASTRGLEKGTMGYVAVFALRGDGMVDESVGKGGLVEMWETPTSGGWANAIQPGPTVDGVEYCALTDSEEGLVMVLRWDGKKLMEVGRVKLDEGAGAATAVWL